MKGIVMVFVVALTAGAVSSVPAAGQEQASCLDSRIAFETGTLERIVREPQVVLDQEEAFWEDEEAQHYTRLWAEAVDYEISYDAWRDELTSLAGMSDAERQSNSLMRTADRIVDQRETFLTRSVPHICSYVPAGSNLDVSVYFTAFIPPRSFLWEGIVINVSADYWQGNSDNILNNLVHEIWHVGYAKARDGRTEPRLENESLYDMLDALQNEGIATYVGHRALPVFPAPDDKDYEMLEDPAEVTRLLGELNQLLASVGVSSEEELGQQSWEIGVIGRAYYVVGAHMAQVIESNLGREALIETVSRGPVSFVEAYNPLVAEQRRIRFE